MTIRIIIVFLVIIMLCFTKLLIITMIIKSKRKEDKKIKLKEERITKYLIAKTVNKVKLFYSSLLLFNFFMEIGKTSFRREKEIIPFFNNALFLLIIIGVAACGRRERGIRRIMMKFKILRANRKDETKEGRGERVGGKGDEGK